MLQNIKASTAQYIADVKAPTPTWAKYLYWTGIVIGSAGSAIALSPALFPAALVSAAGYMIVCGTFCTGIFARFKKEI